MAIRFQRLTTLYPAFARQFLAAHPGWRDSSYDELMSCLIACRFAESNYHALHLTQRGHHAETQFVTFEPLQRQWAAEHRISAASADWVAEITLAQVRAFQPTVLWLDDLYVLDRSFRDRLRRVVGPGTKFVGWRAAPTDDFAAFRDLDLVLTSIRGLERQFRAAGVPVAHIHHAFEASVLQDCPQESPREIAFSFAGQVGTLHSQRAQLVELLLAQTPLEVWGADPPRRWRDRLAAALARWGMARGRKAVLWRLLANHPNRLHPSCFGTDYYRLLGRSQVVLNSHISCSSQDASNMRLFEATGMGACLLTDWKDNLKDLFDPDTEVVTYRSPEECADKVQYLLSHPQQREAIAAAGQRRTLSEHTYSHRIPTLEEILLRLVDERTTRAA